MTEIDLTRWPELAEIRPGVFLEILTRIGQDTATSSDWSELYQQMAHQGTPDSAGYSAVRYLVAHADSTTFSKASFVGIAGVLATGRAPRSLQSAWDDAVPPILTMALETLRTETDPVEIGVVLAAHGRLLGRIAAPRCIEDLALQPEETYVYCPKCDEERLVNFARLGASKQRGVDDIGKLARRTGHVGWANAIEGLAGLGCDDCGASFLDDPVDEKARPTIESPWRDLEACVDSSHLAPPPPAGAIQRLESRIRMAIPESMQDVYRAHDGTTLGLVRGMRLLSCSEAENLWQEWRRRGASWTDVAVPIANDSERIAATLTEMVFPHVAGSVVRVEPGAIEFWELGLNILVAKLGVRLRRGDLVVVDGKLEDAQANGPLEGETLEMLGLCVLDFLSSSTPIDWPGLGSLRLSADDGVVIVESASGASAWLEEVAQVVGMSSSELSKRAQDAAKTARRVVATSGTCRLPRLGDLHAGSDGRLRISLLVAHRSN